MPEDHPTGTPPDPVVDIAGYRKARAERDRRAGVGPESPRDVYLAACGLIGAYLHEGFGFRYARSRPRAWRRSGDFVFEVSFQSNHYNLRGEHVELCVHACVLSPRMKRWRAAQPLLGANDWVAGGQIGNLRPNYAWLTWNLADPGTRDDAIREAIALIEAVAFPVFARFEDLPSLLASLLEEDCPGLEIRNAIELLMCFADRGRARAAGVAFLQRRPEWLPGYRLEYARFAELGLEHPASASGPARLAFASHLFEFGDLSSGFA